MPAPGFQPYSWLHLLSVVVVALCIVAVVRIGLRQRKAGGLGEPVAFDRWLGWVGLVLWLLHQSYAFAFEPRWADAVPLHICDLTALLGPLALLMGGRLLRTLTWFWGSCFAIWGVLTPTLDNGPTDPIFWIFWLNHGLVLLYAVYEVAVRRLRPTAKDYGMACLLSLAYVAVITPLNLAFDDWNFGYLGRGDPAAWTPLDLLPPWPWRILAIEGLGAVMLAHGWVPFAFVRWRSRQK